MKDSGIEWIGEIPEDWDIASIRKLLKEKITDGPHETPNYIEEGIPFISVDSLDYSKNINLSLVKKFISEYDYNNYNKKTKLEEGDVLFTKSATIGKLGIVNNNKFMVWSPIAVLKPNSSLLHRDFLYYALLNDKLVENMKLTGSFNTQSNIGLREIEAFKIPYVKNKISQKNISDYLNKKCEEIVELIKIQEQEIEKLEEYKKSVIYEAVTKGLDPKAKMKDSGIEWIGEIPENFNITKLKYKCEIKTGNSIPDEAKDSYVYTEDSIPYISTKDITLNSNQINYSTGIHINSNDKRFKFSKKDSVLLCIEGGSAGKKVGFTNQEVAFVNKLASIYSNSEINRFIFYSIQSRIFENQFFSEVEGLIGGVGLSDIREFFILSPPLEIQSKISYYLDKKCKEIDTLISKKQEKIEKLEEYKKSVIYECVTGKREV